MSPFIISTFAFGHLVMSQNSLFHLIKFYVRPMPFFPTTCLHSKLAIYQSLLGTVVIETHMLIKIMHFEDRIYGFLI